MLTQPQIQRLFDAKIDAEARACYFAEIASNESTIKRWVTFTAFMFGSATVVTTLSKHPYFAAVFSIIVTAANGYQIAVSQDSKIKTAARLHSGWLRLEQEYDRLWSETWADDAQSRLTRLMEREQDLSETAATEIGHNETRWHYWLYKTRAKYETAGNEQSSEPPNTASTAATTD